MSESHQDEPLDTVQSVAEAGEALGRSPSRNPGGVTGLLQRWANGDRDALDELMPKLIGELKGLARQQLRNTPADCTLDPTSLVNEAYLRLVGAPLSGFSGRGQFFTLAARVLRGVLVDHLRARSSLKRGGDAERLPHELLGEVAEPVAIDVERVVTLHQSLRRLERVDPRRGRVVELRYFGGLTMSEIAAELGVSLPTVERDWRVARRWLASDLTGSS